MKLIKLNNNIIDDHKKIYSLENENNTNFVEESSFAKKFLH
jgi:hypothetical protein